MPAAPPVRDRTKAILAAVTDAEIEKNAHRCYTCSGTSDAWDAIAHKLVNAFIVAEAPQENGGYTGGGGLRDKTKKQREQERAVFEALAMVAADFPGQPLGMTHTAVLLNLRDIDLKHKESQ